jgi:hypothetical protein
MIYKRSPTALFLLAKFHQKSNFNSAPPFLLKEILRKTKIKWLKLGTKK